MDYEAYKKRRLCAEERTALGSIGAISQGLDGYLETLRGRLESAGYRYVNRDKGMLIKTLERLYLKASETVPEDLMQQYERHYRGAWYGVVCHGAKAVKEDYEVIIPESDLVMMADLVLHGHCTTCLKEGNDANTCPTRKMLRRYIDEPEPLYMHCGYAGKEMET